MHREPMMHKGPITQTTFLTVINARWTVLPLFPVTVNFCHHNGRPTSPQIRLDNERNANDVGGFSARSWLLATSATQSAPAKCVAWQAACITLNAHRKPFKNGTCHCHKHVLCDPPLSQHFILIENNFMMCDKSIFQSRNLHYVVSQII